MAALATSEIRNIVLAAHSGAGKTTLADAMYFKSGAVNRRGRVDEQTSLSDYEPEEQGPGFKHPDGGLAVRMARAQD